MKKTQELIFSLGFLSKMVAITFVAISQKQAWVKYLNLNIAF